MPSSADHISDLLMGTDQGNITLAADFPDPLLVKVGWMYTVQASVTDNDPTKTNTGQSFVNGDVIAWNGDVWWLITYNRVNVFVDVEPEDPNNVITVYDTLGRQFDYFHNEQIDPIEHTSIQVRVRNFSYPDAVKEIEGVMLYLSKLNPHDVASEGVGYPAYRYFRITASNGYFSLGKDDKKRSQIVVDFNVSRKSVT